MILEFYDPPMCCSTGLCGPSVDQKLISLNQCIEKLKNKYPNLKIERYMITQQPLKFKENEKVFELVKTKSKSILPITTYNGKIVKTESYPELEELEEILNEN